jgi:IclR family transcriptional regulator, mhp operon transcriptional activator
MIDNVSIRSLSRGLGVLRALNELSGGSINQLAKLTMLPRSTTYRLVKALEATGYVGEGPIKGRYFPTTQVANLGRGLADEHWIREVACPLMNRASHEVLWPFGLSTATGTTLVVRASTDEINPLALRRYRPGVNLDIAKSASGTVLLAFCSDEQRDLILREIQERYRDARVDLDLLDLEARVKRARISGYAFAPQPVCGELGLAVPVRRSGKFFASVSIRYIASAVRKKQAMQQYLPKLSNLAQQLTGSLAVTSFSG